MKKTKTRMMMALGMAMLMAACLPAMAQEPEPEKQPRLDMAYTADDVARPAAIADNVPVYGTVTVLEDGRLYVKTDSAAATVSEMVMGIRQETYILDAVTGETRTAEDIKDGDFIYAYADPVMALSMPPQGGAQLILVGIPADFKVPSYHTVVTASFDSEAQVSTVTTDKGAAFALDDEMDILPYLTFNYVTADQLVPGQRILVWEALQAADSGNEAAYAPYKVMVFAYGYAGWLEINEGAVALSGQVLEGATPYVNDDGLVMLPMRAICEALGWQVGWDSDTRTAIAVKGEATYSMPIGSTEVLTEADDLAYLLCAPMLVNSRTMVTAYDLASLFGLYYPIG